MSLVGGRTMSLMSTSAQPAAAGSNSSANAANSGADTGADELKRTLGLGSVTLFGLAYMAPMIVLGTFGVIATSTAGATSMAYLLATVAMLFTANSYGVLSKRFPVAGSAYTYSRNAIDGRVGFLVGWAVLLDYLFLPMVIWLIGASFLGEAIPGVPKWVWILSFIALTTTLNILGVKVADKVNLVLMSFQILVLAIFTALCAGFMFGHHGVGSLISAHPFVNEHTSVLLIGAGAAVACYSFLGFDAITTLPEEAKNPTHTIPRAIMLVALIGGVIFVIVTYVTTLVHPGTHFANEDTAASEIALQVGGAFFAAVFLAGFIVTQFASGIAAQASAARLMFAMGRDGVLPQRVFSRIAHKFQTPWVAILVSAIVGLGGLFLSVETSTSFINYGAFLAFTMVNICVIVLFFKDRREGRQTAGGSVASSAQEAGRGAEGERFRTPLRHLVLPIIGAGVTIFLFTQLDENALVIGTVWLVLGVVILAFLSKGFRKQPPEQSGH